MSGPFIFIATNRLKPGKLEAERTRVPELCDFIEVVGSDYRREQHEERERSASAPGGANAGRRGLPIDGSPLKARVGK